MGGRGSSGARGGGGNIIKEGSDKFGKPGLYEVYKAGDLSAPNGMVFLSASYGEASNYGKDQGYGSKNIDTYQIQLSNPLVVRGDTDGEMLKSAWETLHPNKEYPKGPMTSSKWQRLDKQNASALAKSPFDSIIYLKKSGRHEVQVPKSRVSELKKTKSDRHSGKFYTYENKWI